MGFHNNPANTPLMFQAAACIYPLISKGVLPLSWQACPEQEIKYIQTTIRSMDEVQIENSISQRKNYGSVCDKYCIAHEDNHQTIKIVSWLVDCRSYRRHFKDH